MLSSKGHQIKIIDFHETNIRGIEKLLMKNNNLLELNLNSKDFRINVGNILEVLGQYCPSLQNCILSFDNILKDATDKQIKKITKGCQYLKCLSLKF